MRSAATSVESLLHEASVIRDANWTRDCQGDVGDHAVAPSADLVPEDAQPSSPSACDWAFETTPRSCRLRAAGIGVISIMKLASLVVATRAEWHCCCGGACGAPVLRVKVLATHACAVGLRPSWR